MDIEILLQKLLPISHASRKLWGNVIGVASETTVCKQIRTAQQTVVKNKKTNRINPPSYSSTKINPRSKNYTLGRSIDSRK